MNFSPSNSENECPNLRANSDLPGGKKAEFSLEEKIELEDLAAAELEGSGNRVKKNRGNDG